VDVQIISLTSDEFREYWCNRKHILIKGLKDIFQSLFLFFGGGGCFGKIR
jgi:hypothetical protein